MATEIYLLSIPLARHRTIVPQRRETSPEMGGSHIRPPEQRVYGVTDVIAESSQRAGTLQRIDSH
jgi:hypothetical protein